MRLRTVTANRLALALAKPQVIDDPGAEQKHEQCARDHRPAGSERDVAKHVQKRSEHAEARNRVGKINQPEKHPFAPCRGGSESGLVGSALPRHIKNHIHVRAESGSLRSTTSLARIAATICAVHGIRIAALLASGKTVPAIVHFELVYARSEEH